MQKRVLLIAGAGTLGGYTSLELLKMGYHVDCIALEDLTSFNKNYTYIKGKVTDELLKDLFSKNHYDCIVDFIHYPDWKNYPERGKLLLENTDQLIFLSSYRVYADEMHPVREDAPQLLYTCKDQKFLETEDYAVPKSHNEDFLRASGYKNWTIIRPVISFSRYRFDIVTQNSRVMLPRILQGKTVMLPEVSKDKVAGVCWAGNTGKIIAHLCCNEKALGEAFTISSADNMTWGEMADIYTELTGLKFAWVDTETYLKVATLNDYPAQCIMLYDRVWDRTIDNSKVLAATGLTKQDFTPIKEALIYEFNYMMDRPDLIEKYNDEEAILTNKRLDEYFNE